MFQIGEFSFDPVSRELTGANSLRRLTPKAAAVLSMLAEADGRVCSRTDIMDRVWPCVTVGEEVLTHAIAELRRALGDDHRTPLYVETVYKKGYRLRRGGARVSRPPAPGEQAPLFELEAYGACLEADEHFHRGGRRSTSAALELYTAALDRHSRYARAHAGLAKTLIFWGAYYDPDDAMFHSAEAHCALALETDPQSADAFAALGLLAAVRGDFAQGWERFRVAIRLAPRSSEIHYLLGRSCLAAGEYTLAAAMLERAASLSAEDFHSPVIAGKARLKSGDAAGAHADFVNALRRSELYLQAYPDSYRAARCKAQCLWHLGHHADAMALVDGMREHPDPMPYYTASFLALAGEKDAALALLPMAIEGGWRHGAFLARDPDFDAMRSESGFRQIARSVGVDA